MLGVQQARHHRKIIVLLIPEPGPAVGLEGAKCLTAQAHRVADGARARAAREHTLTGEGNPVSLKKSQ